jgi:hypothetical protein
MDPPHHAEEPTEYPNHTETGGFTENLFLGLMILACVCRVGIETHRCWHDYRRDQQTRRRRERTPITVLTERLTGTMLSESLLSECPICLEEFTSNEEVAHLPCHHIFHTTCVKEWFGIHLTCPLCRDDLLSRAEAEVL